MKIDINKTYRYRNGQPARVLCVDAGGGQPVVSVTDDGQIRRHEQDGRYYPDREPTPKDLFEVREPREFRLWVATNGDTAVPIHSTDTLPQRSIDGGWTEIRVREIID